MTEFLRHSWKNYKTVCVLILILVATIVWPSSRNEKLMDCSDKPTAMGVELCIRIVTDK